MNVKLLNNPRIDAALRAMDRATARALDVNQSARARRPANPCAVERSTPTPCMGVASPSEPTPRLHGERTSVVGVVGVVGVLLVSAAGCPRLPPVSGCTVGSMSCENDRPRVCSASQRWQPAGDRPCSYVGGVCVVDGAGTARCYGGPR